jgi:cellulose synthase/poly-beta-1,6-N-acetylglucosamine synthase-like glycosyltransferase
MMARGFNRTGHTGLTVSVVICAYTLDRWDLLQRAVASVLAQNVPAEEVIVVIDHNPELAERCRARWPWGSDFRVRVVENVYSGRLGSARNTALELVAGEIVAFLDDDACAPPDWLGRLVAAYESEEQVMAVGGAPEPEFECPRPSWFPFEFDWVFGCSYRGLPVARAPARRLIGANMSVRRSAILAVGGFHSDDHDDMDLSHRVGASWSTEGRSWPSAIWRTRAASWPSSSSCGPSSFAPCRATPSAAVGVVPYGRQPRWQASRSPLSGTSSVGTDCSSG